MPKPSGRHLNFVIILCLVVAVAVVVFITTGNLDPTDVDSPAWRSQPAEMIIPANGQIHTWVTDEIIDPPFTIRMSGSYQSGEKDSGYGLVLDLGSHDLVTAVSPLGYLAVFERWDNNGDIQNVYHLNWQTWPHIHNNTEANEFWINVDGDQIAVRLNREHLWSGEINSAVQAVGLYGESFGKQADVNFNLIEFHMVEK